MWQTLLNTQTNSRVSKRVLGFRKRFEIPNRLLARISGLDKIWVRQDIGRLSDYHFFILNQTFVCLSYTITELE